MSVKLGNVLGAIPVTQQVLGLVCVGAGIVKTIGNVAARIFHGIQRAIENRKAVPNDYKLFTLNGKISADTRELKTGLKMMGIGFITMIPIVGTIYHAKKIHESKNPWFGFGYNPYNQL